MLETEFSWKGLPHFEAYAWSSMVAHSLAQLARLSPGSTQHATGHHNRASQPNPFSGDTGLPEIRQDC